MNRLLAAALVAALAACPSPSGSEGPAGPQGPVGPSGATGATGPQGPVGPQGPLGPAGPQGPQGAMGLQGPMGAVLVLDGGVVTGPAGASVIATPIAVGDSVCAFGGVLLTQLSDAGVSRVCNGATGAAGPAGPTGPVGPAGPTGMTGPAGAQGPVGMTGATGAPGATGATGSTGPAGPTGAAGPTGPAGATGPAGPAGAVLYVDGGVALTHLSTRPRFAGITAFATNGAPTGPSGQLGRLSMNARCEAEFAGSHICNDYEWAESTPFDAVPAPGVWLEYSNTDNTRTTTGAGCNGWTVGTATGGYGRMVALPTGAAVGSPSTITCGDTLRIACCRSPASAIFRGLTTFMTNGAPTGPGAQQGRLSMNARCHAEFPGSHICNDYEWAESTPYLPVPAPGAWLEYTNTDNTRTTTGAGCNGWTVGTATGGYGRMVALPTGAAVGSPSTITCGDTLRLACCE